MPVQAKGYDFERMIEEAMQKYGGEDPSQSAPANAPKKKAEEKEKDKEKDEK